MLTGAAQIKVNRAGDGLRRAVNNGAFIVDFGEPPIGKEQDRAKQWQNYELQAAGACPPPPVFLQVLILRWLHSGDCGSVHNAGVTIGICKGINILDTQDDSMYFA